ncbi:E3 ubiquitin-protein ligase TRIM39-like [Poecilia reticulata]|uniref:E3 ubiquitin-protein ligase TRIM39-like n=1 Tax=Poecilia reticulata TaxID=8081 RepID=UPI0004A3CE42|nr:PREDICTED: E3 ubiquitin-protein ligase TRIM39-like [Poecilia reticulata]
MSSGSNLQSKDQFLCSICLDVFTDPVTTACGHNFCKTSIIQHWDGNVPCKCPLCNDNFASRPQLRVNTLFSEMIDQLRREASSSSEQQVAKPREVPCDVCTGPKLKALKSCLVCLTSYCQTHLEPHLIASRLKKHQLKEQVENLEDRMCLQHDRPLELFCRTDQTCVCLLCPVLNHKDHEFVPLKEESEEKKEELRKTEAQVQKMIQERRLMIQDIRKSVKISKDAADREKAGGVQVVTALMESAERGLKKLIKEIQDKRETTEKQAEDFIRDLEQEISELKKRSSEVKQLSWDEDPLHLLQSFSFLKAAPPTKTWTEVRVHPPSYEGTVVRAVTQIEQEIREKKLQKLTEAELKRVQRFAVDVTLDPDTAQPWLILSGDGKQVNHENVRKNLPDNPERFSLCPCVLGQQSFSSGRFYFEVQVKGKTKWDLEVARESVTRKGNITLSPQNGFWTVVLRNGNKYKVFADPSVHLHLHPGPEKVVLNRK